MLKKIISNRTLKTVLILLIIGVFSYLTFIYKPGKNIAAPPPVEKITTGNGHTCLLRAGGSVDGDVYCWGRNTFGQLGDGTFSDSKSPVRVLAGAATAGDMDGSFLGNIETHQGVKNSLSSGGLFTCAASGSGYVYCWGAGGSGRLGDGNTSVHSVSTPVRVLSGEGTASGDFVTDGGTDYLANIVEIAAGSSFTCALTLDAVGSHVYCWGSDANGKLGNGAADDGTNVGTPVRVLKGISDPADNDGTYLTNIKTISAGTTHACATSHSNRIYCWGSNGRGELGDGTTTQNNEPVQVVKGASDPADNDGTYLANIAMAEAGNNSGAEYSCAVSFNEYVYCWGENDAGYLGDGNMPTDSLTPVRVVKGASDPADNDGTYLLTADPATILKIAHNCVHSSSDNIYCWGVNDQGQVGDGTTTNASVPTKVLKGEALSGDEDGTYFVNTKQISLGTTLSHNCAMSNNNRIYCWGDNDFGELGNGIATDSLTPALVIKDCGTRINTSSTVASLACEFNYTDSPLRIFSAETLGQILVPTSSPQASPLRINTSSTVKSVRRWGI